MLYLLIFLVVGPVKEPEFIVSARKFDLAAGFPQPAHVTKGKKRQKPTQNVLADLFFS